MPVTEFTPVPAPALEVMAHKGMAGRVLCIAGSVSMPGAAVLCVRAAQRAGAGLTTLTLFAQETRTVVASSSPETLYLDLTESEDLFAGRLPCEIEGHVHDVRVVGPGLGCSGRTRELVRRLVGDDFTGPMVLDADALNVVAPALEVLAGHSGDLVLTPHPGEAARLLEREIPTDEPGRIACAREIQERSGGVCVLKGHRTIVTDGVNHYINTTGNAGMATAGAGDVLAGTIGAYLATATLLGDPNWTAFHATVAAVHVHGLAGDLMAEIHGMRGLVASDLVEALPAAQLSFGG